MRPKSDISTLAKIGVFKGGYKIRAGAIAINGVFPNPDDAGDNNIDDYWSMFERSFRVINPFNYYQPEARRSSQSLHMQLANLPLYEFEIRDFVNRYGLLTDCHTEQALKNFKDEIQLFKIFLVLNAAYEQKKLIEALTFIAGKREFLLSVLGQEGKRIADVMPSDPPKDKKDAEKQKLVVPWLLTVIAKRGLGETGIKIFWDRDWQYSKAVWDVSSLLCACYVMTWLDLQRGRAPRPCSICGDVFIPAESAKYGGNYCSRERCGKKASRKAKTWRDKIQRELKRYGPKSPQSRDAQMDYEAWKKEVGYRETTKKGR